MTEVTVVIPLGATVTYSGLTNGSYKQSCELRLEDGRMFTLAGSGENAPSIPGSGTFVTPTKGFGKDFDVVVAVNHQPTDNDPWTASNLNITSVKQGKGMLVTVGSDDTWGGGDGDFNDFVLTISY